MFSTFSILDCTDFSLKKIKHYLRREQRKREWAGQSGKKRKFIRGKREGDWLLRRTSVLPFWRSPSYTPPVKNSLKGWSRSRRSGIWWSHSFEKTSVSKITGCHLGSLVSLTDHSDLFFVCEVDITGHVSNETPCGPYHYPAKIPHPLALQPTSIPAASSLFLFCPAPSFVCLSHSLPPAAASALFIILSSHPNVFIFFYWKCFPGLLLQDAGDHKISGDNHS